MSKKIITSIMFAIFATLLVLTPTGAAKAASEVNITRDGKVFISDAKVAQIAGSTVFARLYWGEAFIRFTIKTNSATKFTRATGEATTIAEIKEGNSLEVSGILDSGGNTLSIVATTIKNSSVQKEQALFFGDVAGIDFAKKQFTLNTKKAGLITVSAGATTQFIKGSRTLDLEHVKIGDYVMKVTGDYDLSTKTLAAKTVVTYVDSTIYAPKNFEGILDEISGTSLPTTLKVSINGTQYTVHLNEKTIIRKNDKSLVSLSRFLGGDTVRLYGAIREVDEPIIDAEIVRDLSL